MSSKTTCMRCMNCKNILTTDDIGLYRKLFDIFAKEYMCISCMSKRLSVSEDILYIKIEAYKKLGCTLFEN